MQRFSRTRRFLHTRTWLVCRFVIGVALGFAALDSLNGKRGELSGATAELAHLHLFWLVSAIGLELLSYVAWGQLQRQLLRAGGVSVSSPYAFGIPFPVDQVLRACTAIAVIGALVLRFE